MRFIKSLLWLALVTLVLGACDMPSSLPPCTPSDLVAPESPDPAYGGVAVNLSPTISWSFPGSCEPDGYHVKLGIWRREFYEPVVEVHTPDSGTSWTVPTPLEAASQINLLIAAEAGGVQGPYLSSYFWTGPICNPSAIMTPTNRGPAHGSMVTDPQPLLAWDYPDACLPEIYIVELYDNPGLTGTNLTSSPIDFWPHTLPDTDLLDCTAYYWRVRAQTSSGMGSFSDTWTFYTDFSGGCPLPPYPTCDPAALVAPAEPIDPGPSEIIGTDAVSGPMPGGLLNWTYPDACLPAGYVIQLSDDPNLTDTSLFGGSTIPYPSWSPTDLLEPARQYWWRVAPWVDPAVNGPFSPYWSFVTGPLCADLTSPTLDPPMLISPADGAVITTDSTTLHYQAIECLPDGYQVDIATDASFSSTSITGVGSIPNVFQAVGSGDLLDCTQYYWRVAPIFGSTVGTYSEVRTFITNFANACTSLACDPASLVAPSGPFNPAELEVITTGYTMPLPDDLLTWTYPDTCIPENYSVYISPTHDFSDVSLFGDSPIPVWGPSSPLSPGTHYWWQVAAQVGSTVGPFSPVQQFLTGPICTDPVDGYRGDPVELISPEDGAILSDLSAMLVYDSGTCLPESFWVDLTTDPTFLSTSLIGEVSPPALAVPVDDLSNCTQYFWKVAPMSGGAIESTYASGIQTFYVDLGNCVETIAAHAYAPANITCRRGDSLQYESEGYFFEGSVLPILGANTSLSWILLDMPFNPCWVDLSLVEIIGPFENVPLAYPPPLFDETEEGPLPPCSTLDQASCQMRLDCEWYDQPNQAPHCFDPSG